MAYFPVGLRRGRGRARHPGAAADRRARSWTPASSPWCAQARRARRRHAARATPTPPSSSSSRARDDAELDEKFAVLRRHLDGDRRPEPGAGDDAAETEHLWRVRKSAVALMQRMPGRAPAAALHRGHLPCIPPRCRPASTSCRSSSTARESTPSWSGHVGDGNIHTRPVLDPKDPVDRVIMQRIYDEVTAYVLSVRGTMAGEHGDGLVHTPRLQEMYGEEIYTLFTRIKNAFDPRGVLNPGKKVGPQEPRHTLFGDVRYAAGYRTLPQSTMLHFPAAGLRERDRALPRLRGLQEHRRHHHVPRLQGHPPGARLAARQGQPAAGHHHRRARARRASTGRTPTKAVTDYCIECGMCAVECPSRVEHPQADAGGQEQVPGRAPGGAGRDDARPRRDGVAARFPRRPAGQPR